MIKVSFVTYQEEFGFLLGLLAFGISACLGTAAPCTGRHRKFKTQEIHGSFCAVSWERANFNCRPFHIYEKENNLKQIQKYKNSKIELDKNDNQ